jgi:hypothetical protein
MVAADDAIARLSRVLPFTPIGTRLWPAGRRAGMEAL